MCLQVTASLAGIVVFVSRRALFTRRRKDSYEALHPETRHGSVGNGREKSCQVGDSTPERFTADTAKKTGQSERAIQRDASRGERVSPEVLTQIAGTKLDTGKALFTRRRKEIYLALHPETKHGTPGVSRQVGDTRERTEAERFTADTATKIGRSELNDLHQFRLLCTNGRVADRIYVPCFDGVAYVTRERRHVETKHIPILVVVLVHIRSTHHIREPL
jgi:hypothetical protein